MSPDNEQNDAANEAAQNVVDRVSSWDYSADEETIGEKLDQGLTEAGVQVSPDEQQRLVEDIGDLKTEDGDGPPAVENASGLNPE